MTDKIKAPFTEDQVVNLNVYQTFSHSHPFTCGGKHCPNAEKSQETRKLIATTHGWVCPCGEYRQDWAHGFMAEDHDFGDKLIP